MKTTIYKSIIFALIIVFANQLNAQPKTVKGVVTAFDSIAIVGATIKAKGTKEVAKTDSMGNFSILSEQEDRLRITAKGFYNERIKLKSKTKFVAVNMKLKPGDRNLEYAFSLTKESDRDVLSSLATKTNEDLDFSMYENMFEAIQGRFPGVMVSNGQIVIRGNNTISGPSPALIVVDGMPTDQSRLNAINPVTVKRINVIKDGTSAIYGAKGANGVIEITTKSGAEMNE